MAMSKSLPEAFRTECEEHLRDLERGLVNLESRPHDEELIHTLFRAAHTIKGNGAVVGEQHLVHFAHVVESLLHCVRERSLDVSPALVSDLLLATDVLSEMVAVTANGGQATSVDERGASARLAVWTRRGLGGVTEGARGSVATVTRGRRSSESSWRRVRPSCTEGRTLSWCSTNSRYLERSLSAR